MPKKYFNKNAGLTYIGEDTKPVKIIYNDFLNKIVYKKKNEDDNWVLVVKPKSQFEDYHYIF
jgi:hypothetical protein